FVLIISGCAYYFRPLQASPLISALGGCLLSLAVILIEMRLERVSLKRLIGAAFGSIFGLFGASLMSLVMARINPENSATLHFFQLGLVLWMTYIGVLVGANKDEMLNLAALGGILGREKGPEKASKIQDTRYLIAA